ncbi:carboxylesterase family protein [Streptomyces sp. NPDC048191]|uniref:carboxylesterase family protein n=1 Tax=Streptomyces sp. NPDC048191 TaxID=3155484 RepID=UPI0033CD81DA
MVVTVNYRLGTFGFFAHPELGQATDFGFADQQAALRRVRENARRFGGDPDRVTLAGQAATPPPTTSKPPGSRWRSCRRSTGADGGR